MVNLLRKNISQFIITSSLGGAILWWSNDRSKSILDPFTAVQKLNANIEIRNAIDLLERFHTSNRLPLSVIHQINSTSWCHLAYRGSNLCSILNEYPFKSASITKSSFDSLVYELVEELKLTGKWKWLKHYGRLYFCREEDLFYETEWNLYQHHHLEVFLESLLHKSEKFLDEPKVVLKLIKALKWMFQEFQEVPQSNTIRVLILKILANLIYSDQLSADVVIESGWLPLIAQSISSPLFPEEPVIGKKICINLLSSLGYCKQNHYLTLFSCMEFEDWLAPDIDRPIRISSIDYTSDIYQLRSGQFMETIIERSENFQANYKVAGIGDRPILFIVHSLGGLLLKHILKENAELRKKTVGILFMATPHKGSFLAAYVPSLLNPTEDLKMLRIENEINRELHNDFMKIVDEIPLICSMLEMKKTPILHTRNKWKLVDEESGALFHSDDPVGSLYHVNEHHFNVCKPDNRDSISYRVVFNFVKDAIHYIEIHRFEKL
uniref:GPI inositol-deacylase n=1 Tax=Acrobeloides nanus TaxID=290746 RepID=A0A914DHX8_9BILA